MAEAKKTEYNSITEALVAFQSNIPVPEKDSSASVGKYSYDYASLDKLTPIIFKALSAVGIAYTAAPTVREDGLFVLRAMLSHTSGDVVQGDYPLGNPSAPAQAIGSAITYARRYALLSLTGVSPSGEDDDGAKAHESQSKAVEESAPPAVNSAQALRDQLGTYITSTDGLLTGDDANEILAKITGGVSPAKWTITDLKKAKTQLEELAAKRKAG